MSATKSFENLAMPHLTAVYRAAFALSGQPHQAEDLAQETFLKAFQRFETFQPGTNCRAWLLQILRNTWIDRLRHQQVAGPQSTIDERLLADHRPEHPELPSDPRQLLDAFSDKQVIAALAALPEDQRLALYLCDVEGLSQEDVAKILDVAVGTIKSRCFRARLVLRAELEAHARDLGLLGPRK